MDTQDQHPTSGIYPLGHLEEFAVADGFPDPRGWAVYGADRQPVGTVEDVLVDLRTLALRYIEVRLGGAGGHVLVPVGLAVSDGPQRVVVLDLPTARAATLAPYTPPARGGPLAREDEAAVFRGLAAVGGIGGADAPPDARYYDRPEFAPERFYRGFAGVTSGASTGGAAAASAPSGPTGAAHGAATGVATAGAAGTGAFPSPARATGDELRVVAMGEEAVVTTRRVVKEVLVIKRRRVVEQQEVDVDLRSERVDVDGAAERAAAGAAGAR